MFWHYLLIKISRFYLLNDIKKQMGIYHMFLLASENWFQGRAMQVLAILMISIYLEYWVLKCWERGVLLLFQTFGWSFCWVCCLLRDKHTKHGDWSVISRCLHYHTPKICFSNYHFCSKSSRWPFQLQRPHLACF